MVTGEPGLQISIRLALAKKRLSPYNQAMPNTVPNQAALGRGYPIALASAVVLSTTAIFIRYLTTTFALPALVLAFWRDVFVTLTMFLVLAFVRPAFRQGDKR